jgi:hypothetical protein
MRYWKPHLVRFQVLTAADTKIFSGTLRRVVDVYRHFKDDLIIQAVRISETLVNFCQTARRHIPVHKHLQSHACRLLLNHIQNRTSSIMNSFSAQNYICKILSNSWSRIIKLFWKSDREVRDMCPCFRVSRSDTWTQIRVPHRYRIYSGDYRQNFITPVSVHTSSLSDRLLNSDPNAVVPPPRPLYTQNAATNWRAVTTLLRESRINSHFHVLKLSEKILFSTPLL